MKKKDINEIIERETYEKHFASGDWVLDNSIYCAKSVADGGRSVMSHQCNRKWTEKVGKYGFCSSHAKEVKLKCGLLEVVGTHYIARFNGDEEPDLSEFDFTEKTDKFYTVVDVRHIIGSISFYTGKQKMDSEWNRKFEVFENESEAWLWLYEQSKKYYENTKEQLKSALENMDTLSSLVKNKVWNKRKKDN